jgi:hypothetical protein
MSATEFIILRIHPDHPKVLRLAALTGEDKWQACGRAVAWFRYVDQYFADAKTGLDRQMFNDIIGSRGKRGKLDYFDAMQDEHINWIKTDDSGHVAVVEYDSNFGRSSKRRAMDARYQSGKRRVNVGETSADRRQNVGNPDDELTSYNHNHNKTPLTPQRGEGGGALASLLGRMKTPAKRAESVAAIPGVTGATLLAHWAEVVKADGVRSPGLVVAKRAEAGEPPPRLTAEHVVTAVKRGIVQSIDGQPIGARKVAWNSAGLMIDGKLTITAERITEVEYA